MSDITYIGNLLRRYEDAPQLAGYSRVEITVSDEISYSAGSDTGRTLAITNPFGTQEMADNILSLIWGFQYKPYTAENAILDPAAELGDGINVGDSYSGIYALENKFGGKYSARVSAPCDEELDHEYPYKSPQQRQITRSLRGLTAELKIQAGLISAEVAERKSELEQMTAQLQLQAGLISAKVSKTGGDASSFGWDMSDTYWEAAADGSTVFRIDKSGADVRGKITALSGKIGGFDILSDYLSYNGQTWGGTNTVGGYLGVNGLQMGKNFKVDMSGNLYAASGEFSGNVRAGSIQYGGDNGYLSGSGISSHSLAGNRLQYNTVSTSYTSGGINTSLGYADFANGVFNGWNKPSWIKTRQFTLGDYNMGWTTINYIDHDGNNRSVRVATGQ